MRHWVRIFAHDQSYGLWDADNGPIDPDTMPISQDLRRLIDEWITLYWERLEPMPGRQRLNFRPGGLYVAWALKTELPDWTVLFCDQASALADERLALICAGAIAKLPHDSGPTEYEILKPWPMWLHRCEWWPRCN